jgi:flagellar biosynthesis/type III secretory pathway M-ring protein FliF/YscJ
MPSWLIWVIVAVLVVVVIAAIVAAGARKKRERDRMRALEMREQAAEREPEVRQREAHARETEAEAAAARAEADRKQAEAERLAAAAEDRHRVAGEAREEHQEHLRRADEVDPDVDHKAGLEDDRAVETEGVHPSEQRVTHPDGTTETVNDPRER